MTPAGHRQFRRRLFRLCNHEQGAVLWVPAILFAAVFLLWAIQIVPSDSARYTQSHDFLIILGPVGGLEDEPATVAAFRVGLRARLEQQRELHLIPEQALQERVHAVLGSVLPENPQDWIRATRNFKARFFLAGQMSRHLDGELITRIEIWEGAAPQPVDVMEVRAKSSGIMARMVADSLGVALFEPQLQRNAQR